MQAADDDAAIFTRSRQLSSVAHHWRQRRRRYEIIVDGFLYLWVRDEAAGGSVREDGRSACRLLVDDLIAYNKLSHIYMLDDAMSSNT